MLSTGFLPAIKRQRPAPRRRFVPRPELLEGRALPSTFMVLNLADAGDGSLRQAILDANVNPGPDAIDFTDGLLGTIPLTTGQLSITDHLTVNGPGADLLAVSGSGQSRIFQISGGVTVEIARLTIMEGKAVGDGGGILNTGGTVTLAGVVLSGNQAVGAPGGPGRGGAIANTAGATLTVSDCLFTNNQARGGGQGFGGGIFNAAPRLTVSGSTFIGNQALGGAGGGAARGGGIDTANTPDARITDCTFIGNQAIAGDGSGGIGFGRGGGLYNTAGTVTVEDSIFLGNLARGGSNNVRSGPLVGSAGGAGIFNADGGTLCLSGSTVTGSRALGGSGNISTGGNGHTGNAFGGGLNNVGTATLTNCLFEDNEARGGSGNRGDGASSQFVGTGMGGAISTSAQNTSGLTVRLTLSNVTLRQNRAIGGEGNTAGAFVDAGIGAGLANDGSNAFAGLSRGSEVMLLDSIVAHNQAVGGRGGAALGGGVSNVLGGVAIISGSTLTHNRAQGGDGGDGSGGGIYNAAASSHPSNSTVPTVLRVDGCAITHNRAQGGAATAGGSIGGDGLGGGLWNDGTASVLEVVITHNHALGGDGADERNGGNGLGGGVYNEATAALRLERSTVTQNHANGGDRDEGENAGQGIGGGVYNLGLFDLDLLSMIFENHASTSHDDLFDLVG